MFVRLLPLLFGAMLCASACSPILYTPPLQNVALPEKKGDGSLTAAYGLRGIEAQYAGAVSDGLLVLASLRGSNRLRESASFNNVQPATLRHRQLSGEAGAGAYGRFGGQGRGAWSIVGGYGLGRTTESPESGRGFVRSFARYRRAFVQPALGYVVPHFDVALSLQGAWVTIGDIESGEPSLNGARLSALTLEPALSLSAGGPNLRFFAQVAATVGNEDYAKSSGDLTLSYSEAYSLSLGMKVLFGQSGNLMWFGRE
jgi:hypothetical protein